MRQSASRECRRCGTCCQVDFNAFVTQEDIDRWRTEGRKDILQVLEHEDAIWMGNHLVSRVDEQYLHSCPFLQEDGERFFCAIYATRPRTCREFQSGSSPLCPQYTDRMMRKCTPPKAPARRRGKCRLAARDGRRE